MRGFTLVETLIVVAILVVVASVSMPALFSVQSGTSIRATAESLTHTFRYAQQLSRNGYQNDSWGVYIDDANKHFVLYRGVNYGARVAAYDEIISYPPSQYITTTYGDDLIFSRYSGLPLQAGTTTISIEGSIVDVSVGNLGLIQSHE